jgi:hypothetical protein
VQFELSESRADGTMDLVHADVMGPFPTESLAGSRYVLVLLDDYSRYSAVVTVAAKSQVASKAVDVLQIWQRQCGRPLKTFRTDGGKEFLGELAVELRKTGVVHQVTTPYTPQQNGRAERVNRTLADKIRALLLDSGLPEEFWGEAIQTANKLRNMAHCAPIKDIPERLFTGKAPNFKQLRVFGCLAYVHVDEKHQTKTGERAERGIFVGYSDRTKGYREIQKIDNRWKARKSRDVTFIEDKQGYAVLNARAFPRLMHTPRIVFTGTPAYDPSYQPSSSQPVSSGEMSDVADAGVASSAEGAQQPENPVQGGSRQSETELDQPEAAHTDAIDHDDEVYGTPGTGSQGSAHDQSEPSALPQQQAAGSQDQAHQFPVVPDLHDDVRLPMGEVDDVQLVPVAPAVERVVWHTNLAQLLLEAEAQYGLDTPRPQRIRRKPYDVYADRFIEGRVLGMCDSGAVLTNQAALQGVLMTSQHGVAGQGVSLPTQNSGQVQMSRSEGRYAAHGAK